LFNDKHPVFVTIFLILRFNFWETYYSILPIIHARSVRFLGYRCALVRNPAERISNSLSPSAVCFQAWNNSRTAKRIFTRFHTGRFYWGLKATCISARTSTVSCKIFIEAENVWNKFCREQWNILCSIDFVHKSWDFRDYWTSRKLYIHFRVSMFSNQHGLPITPETWIIHCLSIIRASFPLCYHG
jgi:hypothetical protein